MAGLYGFIAGALAGWFLGWGRGELGVASPGEVILFIPYGALLGCGLALLGRWCDAHRERLRRPTLLTLRALGLSCLVVFVFALAVKAGNIRWAVELGQARIHSEIGLTPDWAWERPVEWHPGWYQTDCRVLCFRWSREERARRAVFATLVPDFTRNRTEGRA